MKIYMYIELVSSYSSKVQNTVLLKVYYYSELRIEFIFHHKLNFYFICNLCLIIWWRRGVQIYPPENMLAAFADLGGGGM